MRNFRFLLPNETSVVILGDSADIFGGIAHIFDEDGGVVGLVPEFIFMHED